MPKRQEAESTALAVLGLEDIGPVLPPPPEGIPPVLVRSVLALWWAGLAEETWRGYQSSWRVYQRWCHAMELPPLPIDQWALALFLADHHLTHKPQSLERIVAALQEAHRIAGYHDSIRTRLIQRVLRGTKRRRHCRPVRKDALTTSILRQLVSLTKKRKHETQRIRDKALYVTMFAAALRRSDAARLDIGDVQFADDGGEVFLHLRYSKTDQEGVGRIIPVTAGNHPDTDPVSCLRELVNISPKEGPLFRRIWSGGEMSSQRLGGSGISSILNFYLKELDVGSLDIATHSFRAGLVTESKRAGIADAVIRIITGHEGDILNDYVRLPSTREFDVTRRIGL